MGDVSQIQYNRMRVADLKALIGRVASIKDDLIFMLKELGGTPEFLGNRTLIRDGYLCKLYTLIWNSGRLTCVSCTGKFNFTINDLAHVFGQYHVIKSARDDYYAFVFYPDQLKLNETVRVRVDPAEVEKSTAKIYEGGINIIDIFFEQ